MTEFTPEKIEEIEKCSEDPVYFINNYVKFNHYANGLSGIKLYEPQEELIRKYHNNRFNILKAPRRIAGKSSTAIFYILHHIIFGNEKQVALVSHHTNPSIHLLNSLKFSYENLPKWMQHDIILSNKTTLELGNGSCVIATSLSPDYFRGKNFSLVVLDELGYNTSNKVKYFFNSVPSIHCL